MLELLQGSGIFVYPLAICSFVAVFIIVERLLALRPARIIPDSLVEHFIEGDLPAIEEEDLNSVGGRIVSFYRRNNPDPEGLKAFARLEVTRMERGIFLLEVVVGAAPLIGLLGTVTGLVQVFSNFNVDTGMPNPGDFVQGIALALSTTILGLAVAIPALVGNAYLLRRVDTLAARLNVGVERLIDLSKNR
ncbi:MAG: MotA/TolQ/ExbB proton channel family protein [Opitutales bacterium]